MAHNVRFDRDDVLRPAFERVEALDKFPDDSRWKCTMKLANRLLKLKTYQLDDVLSECGLKRRDEDAMHDAQIDAECAAKVYMHCVKLPPVTHDCLFYWYDK